MDLDMDGTQSDPPIVWIHGAGMDRTIWSIAARDPALSARRSLAIDLPGHGRSAEPACRSIPDYAQAVLDLLDRLEIAQAQLVGHSMGALIVLEVLHRWPGRVCSIVLAGAAARMPVNPALIEAARHDLPRAARMIATFAVASQGRRAAAMTPGIRLGGVGVALLENSRHGVLAGDLEACDAVQGEVGMSPVPALVVSGTLDRMVQPRRSGELAQAISARQAQIDGAGHMMMLERPQAFADAVVPFLLAGAQRSLAR